MTATDYGKPGELQALPAISIIIPVYNTAKYLDRCLDSIAGQTFSDFEVLCIDDGSTDGSGELLDARAAADPRFHVEHRSNAGASASRNFGLDLACGDYVLFVDSDDYIDLHTCQTLIEAARRDSADIVVFGGSTFPSVAWIDRCLSTRDVTYRGEPFRALLDEGGSYPLMCNKFYRRSFLEANELRFNTSLVLGEDNAFQFLCFPHANNVTFISDALYHYRCAREGSAMTSHYADLAGKVEKHFQIVEFVATEWKKRGFISAYKARFVDWMLFFLFDDVKNLSFADRMAFGARLNALLVECGLAPKDCSRALDPIAAFLLQDYRALDKPDRPVAVTVLLRSLGQSEDAMRKGFLHTANQSEQRLEFIVVGESSERADACVAALQPDYRISAAATVDEALAKARGRFVLFADFDDEYDWAAFEKALAAVRAEDVRPDVVILRDALGKLRMTDVFRMVGIPDDRRVEADGSMKKHFAFHMGELTDFSLAFASLDDCNKLWSTEFLRAQGHAGWGASDVARLLLAADTSVMLREILCEKKSCSTRPNADMTRLLDEAAQARAFVKAQALPEPYLAQTNGFVLAAGMRVIEGKHTFDGSRRAAELFVSFLRENDVMDVLPDFLYAAEDDYKAAVALVEAESLDDVLFEHLLSLRRKDGAYIQGLEVRVEDLEKELGCVYHSLSFKVGRSITSVPRKLRDTLTRR